MSALTLDRSSLSRLVHEFYGDVRADPVLGPVFDNAIGDHWDAHFERLTDFWCTVMLGTREFQGNVFGTHMQIRGVEPEHFRRWLDIFGATVARLFAPDVADEFMLVARRIAGSLQYGYFGKIEVQ
ncbi:group III truncated hemoglobin [Pseudoduganella sp. GCM10020061]|jgi:hemoglobin|uniref:group III truncated hemoglobin n=1 Tax=Pseudoduganella sp. GCM10020061 TaxID=3317345 RepID=UPI003626464D